MFKIEKLIENAKKKQKTIVFPEVSFSDRTVEAVKILQKKNLAKEQGLFSVFSFC